VGQIEDLRRGIYYESIINLAQQEIKKIKEERERERERERTRRAQTSHQKIQTKKIRTSLVQPPLLPHLPMVLPRTVPRITLNKN
jgi:hypothetical protein